MFSVRESDRQRFRQIIRNGKALAVGSMAEAGLLSAESARQALQALLADGPSERAEEELLKLGGEQERPQ